MYLFLHSDGDETVHVQYQRDVSLVLERTAELQLRAGDIMAALSTNEESLKIRRQLAVSDPGSVDRQMDISISLEKIGELRLYNGDSGVHVNAQSHESETSSRPFYVIWSHYGMIPTN